MNFIYKSNQDAKPLPARIPFRPTHVMRTPPPIPGDKHQYIPREMELSITDSRIVDALVSAGWTVVEVLS